MTAQGQQTYSQHGEDTFILAHFGERVGRFLDIGAWHAKQFSNTRALYEAGWAGVLIEPSPGPMAGLITEYGADDRITLIQAALGVERSIVRLRVSDDAISTTEEANYAAWKEHAHFNGSVWVPSITFHDLFNQFGGPFHFVNIDTEGTSCQLLRELLTTALFPECICVEHDGGSADAIMHAQEKGYGLRHLNGTNVILARST